MQLLKKLCSIHAPSGDEAPLKDFILEYVKKESAAWKRKPRIYTGPDLQDCIILSFGKPRTAVFAHMDSIGFTARYKNELVKIGGPTVKTGIALVGKDSKGKIEGTLVVNKKTKKLKLKAKRIADTGTSFTFKMDFRTTRTYIQSCYLDNRLGVWTALKLAEELEHGAIVFSCWEEHSGGSVGYLARFLYTKFKIRQALICDVSWVTEGVKAGGGPVISLRDSGIPRQAFVRKIVSTATKNKLAFQLEVESSGGSDGNEIQKAPYPIDWCFVGPPEQHVHTPDEKVHRKDIDATLALYKMLVKEI